MIAAMAPDPKPVAPARLTPEHRTLSTIAARHGLALVGEDQTVTGYAPVSISESGTEGYLTYAVTREYLERFLLSKMGGCVIPKSLSHLVPPERSALVSAGDASEAFYSVFAATVEDGGWTHLSGYRGSNTYIASSATVYDDVVIGDDCVIMDNVVLLPQTYIGDGVVIKPQATIGSDGFQLTSVDGRRRRVPHAGGVFIGEGVGIGAQTCVDRGLFGDFTRIGPDSQIDNLVHVAHSVTIGSGAAIVACAEVSGSVTIGDGAWLGPSCAINPSIQIGSDAMIGTGSTVVRDIPANAVAFGAPARIRGWRCACGERLEAQNEAECARCRRRYLLRIE